MTHQETTTSERPLRVDKPCPYFHYSGKRRNADYYCGSCSKTLTDFRGMPEKEIKQAIQADTCGVFTADQLPGQQKMLPGARLLFHVMAVLSILGFSVRPVAAQAVRTKKETIIVDRTSGIKDDQPQNHSEIKPEKRNKATKRFFRKRKKEYRIYGCPSF